MKLKTEKVVSTS